MPAKNTPKTVLILVLFTVSTMACTMTTTATLEPEPSALALPSITPPPTRTPLGTPGSNVALNGGGGAALDDTQDAQDVGLQDTVISGQSYTDDDTVTSADTVDCVPRTDWPIYAVVAGDVLASIARRSGSTIDALALANCLDDPDTIRVGQSLYVPQVPAAIPTNTPNYQPPVPGTNLYTYTSPDVGVTFAYRSDWFVSHTPVGLAYRVSVTTFDPAVGPPAMAAWAIGEGQLDLQIIYAPATPAQLDDWVAAEKTQLLHAMELVEEVQITLASGHTATRLVTVSGSGHVITHIYTNFNGRNTLIRYDGRGALARVILDSLRPLSP